MLCKVMNLKMEKYALKENRKNWLAWLPANIESDLVIHTL